MSKTRDDTLTIIGIAIAAMCIATAAHEAIGHGGVCLAYGGHITRLTSVFFQCSARNTWVAAGGPAGNLAAALLAWIGLRVLAPGMAQLRLLLILVMAISLYWFAGYLLFSAVKNDGDLYFVAKDLIGTPNVPERLLAGVIAVLMYGQAMRAVGAAASRFASADEPTRPRGLLRMAWFAATLSACIASLFYAPDRLEATHQAALEVGLAAFPLLAHPYAKPRAGAPVEGAIERSWAWIGGALLLFAAFVATLGRGIS